MSLVASIEADIKNFDDNISKASRIMNDFAAKTQNGIDGLNKSFSTLNGGLVGGLQSKLSSLKANLENATDIKSVVKYNIRIKETQNELDRLKTLGVQASGATKNIINPIASKNADSLSSSLKRTGSVAMEFNRIIQDAPFGMMGISNNLTQLTDNYKAYATAIRQAAAEQGKAISSFQIFKGAVAGILSPINLFSLGISAVTSGIIMYQMWQQRASKATKESTDKFKELVDGLGNVNTAMYEAAKSSGAEVAQLKVLYSTTQDVTKGTNDREKAASDLIKQYPALFGKFTEEQILLGKAKVAYDNVSSSIIATARAQAAYGKIGEKSSMQLAIDETNRSLQKEIKLLDSAIRKQESMMSAGKGVGAVSESIEMSNVSKVNSLYEERRGIMDQVTKNLIDRAGLQEEINQLEGLAISNQSKIIDLDDKGDKAKKSSIKTLAEYKSELVDLFAGFGEYSAKLESISNKFDGFRVLASKAGATLEQFQALSSREWSERFISGFERFGKVLDSVKSQTLPFDFNINIDVEKISEQMNKASEVITKKVQSIKSTFDSITIDIGQALGEVVGSSMQAIGEAMANGNNVIDAIGKSILSTLGSLAVSIGKQMIAFGTAALGLQQLMSNPYLAIAAGAALVALGSAASSSINKQLSSAGAGGYSSNSGISNTQYAQPILQGAYASTEPVVFEISGDKLRGVLNRYDNKNNRSGGTR